MNVGVIGLNKLINKVTLFLRVLITPSCWIQNETYSEVWDSKLNSLMETNSFALKNEYCAEIGGICVWIANHPYASFAVKGVRPSRSTILKAYDKLMLDYLNIFNGK